MYPRVNNVQHVESIIYFKHRETSCKADIQIQRNHKILGSTTALVVKFVYLDIKVFVTQCGILHSSDR